MIATFIGHRKIQNSELLTEHTPSLTTVQQNFLAIGKNAVQNMLYMLENKTILNTVTDTKIFLRDSTAAI